MKRAAIDIVSDFVANQAQECSEYALVPILPSAQRYNFHAEKQGNSLRQSALAFQPARQDFLRRNGWAMQLLEEEVKKLIIDVLDLDHVRHEDIDTDAPLSTGELGLGSIDELELIVALNRRYGISLLADSEETRAHFSSVRTLASLIANRRTK